MHVYPNHVSLVLLAKETKWIYAANWGRFFKVAFLGHDPLTREAALAQTHLGALCLKFPVETFYQLLKNMAVAYGMFGLIQLFPCHLFSSFIYLNERYFMSSSMNKDSVLETNRTK